MNHEEDPNHGPARSPPVLLPPLSPSLQAVASPTTPHPSAVPTSVHGQSPALIPPFRCPPGIARPKPPLQSLEIPPRPVTRAGSMSPHSQFSTFSPTQRLQPSTSPGSQAEAVPPPPSSQPSTMSRPKPYIQPLEIPPTPVYQMDVTSPTPQVAAMSPKPSPASQGQSISSTPQRTSITMSPTSHTQMMAMSPTPHRQPMMMVPSFPQYQPQMYLPPPYYHPGPPFNVTVMPTGGFQAPNHYYPEHERAWSTDLFDCTKDIRNCSRTICCPCVTFGQIAEIVNEGTTPWYEPALLCGLLAVFTPISFILHPSFPYTACYRTKLRNKYKLKGSVIEDCLVHSFCECCALCQEFRELDHQGFDVPLGWHENKRRERQAVAVFRFIPPEEQGMTR